MHIGADLYSVLGMIMSGARNYTGKTIKRLFGLARNKCAFPHCEKEMSDENSAKHSNICHIEAANKGGERWNYDMTDLQRADYDNLILLCPPHHEETNDYSVADLKSMKKMHEDQMAQRLSNERPLIKRPSLLTEVINKISSTDIDEVEDEPVDNAFAIQDKLDYNCVVSNRPLIESYKIYQGKINALYSEIERAGSSKKKSILRIVKHFYLEAKGRILGHDQSLKAVKNNADQLIDSVRRKLHEVIEDSANNHIDASYEEIEFAVSIIVVDGFLRCKILEEPVDDSK